MSLKNTNISSKNQKCVDFLPFTEIFRKEIIPLLFCIKKFNIILPFSCVEDIYSTIAKDRFRNLFSGFADYSEKADSFLKEMTNMGNIIAGGSIVYSLCSHVIYNDSIDIYTSSYSALETTFTFIESKFGNGKISFIKRDGYHHESYYKDFGEFLLYANQTKKSTSKYYFGIAINYYHIKFKLIFLKFKNWEDIVNTFALDYLKCAYLDSTFYSTTDCRRAHSTRIIKYKYCNKITRSMCNKAWKKGFITPKIISTFSQHTVLERDSYNGKSDFYKKKFLPLVKVPSGEFTKEELKDETIISVSCEKYNHFFNTDFGNKTNYINIKLDKLKNLKKSNIYKDVFTIDPIYIGSFKISYVKFESFFMQYLKDKNTIMSFVISGSGRADHVVLLYCIHFAYYENIIENNFIKEN